MNRLEQQMLDADAERRLRQFLQREPSAREIKELREGEKALGLEAVAKAQQLRDQARELVRTKNEVMRELRQRREAARRLRRKAA